MTMTIVLPAAARAVAVAALAAALSAGIAARADAQARLSDDALRRPDALAPALERLDEALRQRLTSADDAASLWMAGEFETLDPALRVRDFGAAAARAPTEMLFAASLARACVPRTIPTLAECATRDSVASFATRDPDNAVPWLLLAERARQRRASPPVVTENLERAAKASRFDDYTQHAAPMFAATARALPAGSAPVLDAIAAAGYVDRAAGGLAPTLTALCGPRREVTGEGVTIACQRIAALMVERAPNGADQALGASLAGANAPSDSARSMAQAKARDIAVRRQRCAETFDALARIAVDPASPAAGRAQAAAAAWTNDRARGDEFAACERLAAAIATK
jgi:hypothetical protein